MATAKQIAANRRNSQKSCGPKAAETKAIVSQNSTKHGLCAKFRVLDEVEKQENFDIFLNQLMQDEQPVGQAEIELVVKMAEHTWLSKRALNMQNNCFSLAPKTPEQIKNNEVPVGVELQPLEVLRRRGVFATTLRHEFVHAALDALGHGRAPLWLEEGLAILVAGEGPQLARTAPREKIPADELERELENPASPQRMRALYAAAYAEVSALIRREGESTAWRRAVQ